MVGLEVLLKEENLQTLKRDNFYFFQIIGCSVISKRGEKIGRIVDILCIRDNDLLVVEAGKKEVLIPFIQSICLEIRLKQREIVIDPPEGLLELNEI